MMLEHYLPFYLAPMSLQLIQQLHKMTSFKSSFKLYGSYEDNNDKVDNADNSSNNESIVGPQIYDISSGSN